ncbi:CpsD/CapB family tyrosine-protein kinase [Paenibacillus sp. SYP-B3998]|uniref:non-specific protein-tyrosine kinase n=1 Tax=Paenibacillus sp. SYP-B3998 TaxID=2678564 RepID=A0A6G3ZT09_9BACL|nr:CpsD/CapB family tyrosine-protein kinase [Paenibacillus sp. SYP-B3998]NEW04721.1 CpsD/CapB family tyrosine-protein kinase [Paenibacillus sp. SYP-B3998]
MSRSVKQRPIITNLNPKSPISEVYRTLRTNIQFSSVDMHYQTLMITSSGPMEGKSTTINNLAVVYAQTNKKVLLIDADLRKPTAHHTFRISNRHGLTDMITNQCSLDMSIKETDIQNLSVMTAGTIPPNPSEILASQKMSGLLEELKEKFDFILIDTPPVLAVSDAQIIATKCDGVILVVDAGRVKREVVLKAKSSLEFVKAHILGVVLNKISQKESVNPYFYYGGEESQ